MPSGVEPNNRFMPSEQKIKELEKRLDELKERWPAHSVPPSMWMELERLEEELDRARADEREKNG
jgi:hypothetical protein